MAEEEARLGERGTVWNPQLRLVPQQGPSRYYSYLHRKLPERSEAGREHGVGLFLRAIDKCFSPSVALPVHLTPRGGVISHTPYNKHFQL